MKKTLAYIGIALLVTVSIGAGLLVWGFSPGKTKQLESIAAQFKPDPSWTLESETINPARRICLQADCDSLRKVWQLPSEIKLKDDFKLLLSSGNTEFILNDECSIETSSTDRVKECEASASSGDYRVTVRYTSYPNENPNVILNIEK